MPRVFVSHSSEDRTFVENDLLPSFEAAGITAWYSANDVLTAEEWERSILQGP
jgi:hypothetical protein